MKKILILCLLLTIILCGCDKKSEVSEVIPTDEISEEIPTKSEVSEPEVSETIPEETTPTIVEPTTPISTITLPDSKLVIDQNGEKTAYYLWTDNNNLYVVESPMGLKSLNGYINLADLAKDIDLTGTLDFGVTIDILMFILEDFVDYLKMHAGSNETGEYIFSGEELVALVKLFIPEENISEEFLEILKTVGDNANVTIKIENGMLVNLACNYYDNYFRCNFIYVDGILNQMNASMEWEQTILNPENSEDYLTYQIKGTCSLLITDASLTLNLDSEFQTISSTPELCQEVDYDFLLMATKESITFNGNIYGASFTGTIQLGENISANISAQYLEDVYTITFETGVTIPLTIKNDIVMAASTNLGGLYQTIIESMTKKFNLEHFI